MALIKCENVSIGIRGTDSGKRSEFYNRTWRTISGIVGGKRVLGKVLW